MNKKGEKRKILRNFSFFLELFCDFRSIYSGGGKLKEKYLRKEGTHEKSITYYQFHFWSGVCC